MGERLGGEGRDELLVPVVSESRKCCLDLLSKYQKSSHISFSLDVFYSTKYSDTQVADQDENALKVTCGFSLSLSTY